MAFTQKELRITTCAPAATTSFTLADNSVTYGIAVSLEDAPSLSQSEPFPRVVKTPPDTGGTERTVYGAFFNFEDNGETSSSAVGDRRVGVITNGIVPFRVATSFNSAAGVAAVSDVGLGITGSDTATDTAGDVLPAAGGRGRIVAIGDAGKTIYVDLDGS